MLGFKIKFSGVTILQGVEFSIFPIDFEWALQQCSATALPVIDFGSAGLCLYARITYYKLHLLIPILIISAVKSCTNTTTMVLCLK